MIRLSQRLCLAAELSETNVAFRSDCNGRVLTI